MEYLYTNLPRYITVTPRSAFADSVVQSGSVLLFSEDGISLTAKLPDGSFVTVGGGSGTDVSDTTATAADVLSGKDFYLSTGVKTTGSIQTVTASASGNVVTVPAGYIASQQTLTIGTAKAAATYTPGTTDQTITAGQYLTGDQTIKGDANLLAANIVSGVTIFGVTGTASGGGATGFYKCATVDTVNHTWTGYKAVFDSVTGIYGYEVTATTGLTYSLVTPVVGRVYADGALIEAKLWEGILLPDSPFAYGYPDPTWTSGQKLSSWGTFTQSDSTKQFEIATINGVTGLQNAAGMSMTAPSAITGNFSFCVKAYIAPDAALSGSCPLLDTNSWGGALFALWANSDSGTYPMLSMRGYSFEAYSAPDMSNVSGVHTLVMTYNTDGTTKLYFDNVLAASEYYDPGFDHSQTLYLLGDTANVLTLGVAAYNRELTAAEAASIIW